MGLDMYLYKKVYVKNWEYLKPEEKHHVTYAIGQGEDNKRKAAAERRKEKEKRERETYERLKKKYGDK